jgi:hypothetical protein
MADHLTPDGLARYVKRALSPAELIVADRHLAACELCRKQVSDPQKLEDLVTALRHDLETQAQLDPIHIAYEQLEAYVDNEADAADREIVDSHVELCRTCREELRDLQEFRLSLQGREASSHLRQAQQDRQLAFGSTLGLKESLRPLTLHSSLSGGHSQALARGTGPRTSFWERATHFWRYPGYLAGVASVVAIVLVVVWPVPTRRYLSKGSDTGRQSGSSNAEPDRYVVAQPELQTPAELAALIGKPETLLGTATQSTPFALLAPVGTFVEDARPTFRWQPLSAATSYKITVFDSVLNEVAASPALSGTDWKPSVPLEHGKVYLWQVVATRGGEQVVAPAPPAPEAKFEILDLSQANSLAQVKREQPNAHFTLGRAYASSGVLDEAEREFRLVSSSDADYALAQKFIADLAGLRHPGH